MPILKGHRRVVAPALIVLVMLGTGVPSIAGPHADPPHVQAAGSASAAAAERRKVLMTLENRMSDENALKRIREKISELDGRRLRIAAALCSRIERDESSAGADIAFSLVTALIILS
jgi:hypothetical protein